MNIEHTITGWTVVSDIIENTMVTRKYQGYSDEECKEMFLSEFPKKTPRFKNVKIITASSEWETAVNHESTDKALMEYFGSGKFNVGTFPEEKMEYAEKIIIEDPDAAKEFSAIIECREKNAQGFTTWKRVSSRWDFLPSEEEVFWRFTGRFEIFGVKAITRVEEKETAQ